MDRADAGFAPHKTDHSANLDGYAIIRRYDVQIFELSSDINTKTLNSI